MVSFSCEVCNDTVLKKKADQHTNRCRGAYFTCIDCSTTFEGTSYRGHTSCMTEAEKYEKGLHKPKKQKTQAEASKQSKEKKSEDVRPVLKSEGKAKTDSKVLKKSEDSKKTNLNNVVSKKQESLYKVIKTLGKADNKSTKELLKLLKVVKNEKGNVVLSL